MPGPCSRLWHIFMFQHVKDLASAMQGLAEWRSIQDVVQLTFQAFFDALKTQGDAIKGLEKSRDQFSVSIRTEMSTALRSKANGSDLTARLTQLESQLAHKADISDMDRRAMRNEVEASQRTQMSDIMALIKAKQEESATKAWQESCERQLAALRSDVARLGAAMEEIKIVVGTKAGAHDMAAALALKADASEMDQRLKEKASRKLLGETLSAKADAAAVEQRLSELRAQLADVDKALRSKTDQCRTDEVVRGMERLTGRRDADVSATTAALEALTSKFDDALSAQASALVSAQVSTERLVSSALDEAQKRLEDLSERHGAALARKADASEVARLLSETRGEVTGLRDALSGRATTAALAAVEGQVATLSLLPARVDALVRDLTERSASVRELTTALEGKANVTDVNKALVEVCTDLSTRAPAEQLDGIVARIEHVANSVTSHTLMARWLWKSGQLHAGGQVSWEVEALNAAPGVFLWEASQPVVVAVLPGLYRLSFGFFTHKRPLVQVLINGEPAWTASSTAPAGPTTLTTRHASEPLLHSAGNVLGLTGSEFVSLPAHARLSVLYQGDPQGAEGFLMLHKL